MVDPPLAGVATIRFVVAATYPAGDQLLTDVGTLTVILESEPPPPPPGQGYPPPQGNYPPPPPQGAYDQGYGYQQGYAPNYAPPPYYAEPYGPPVYVAPPPIVIAPSGYYGRRHRGYYY